MPQIQRGADQPGRGAVGHAQRTAEFGGREIPDRRGAGPAQPNWVFSAGQPALRDSLTRVQVGPMRRDLQPPSFGDDQGVFVGLRSSEGACRIQLSQLIFEHAFNIRLGAASPTAIRRVTANRQHLNRSGQHPSDPDNTCELTASRGIVRQTAVEAVGLEVGHPFPRLVIAASLYLDLGRSLLDLGEFVGRQFEVGGAQVLLQPVRLARARDRDDPRLLGE